MRLYFYFVLFAFSVVMRLELAAQLAIPADVNFFAGGAASKRSQNSSNDNDAAAALSPEAKALPHALLFYDGRQLRGELMSLTKSEVIVKRPDASEPLRIPRNEVRRIVISEPPENQTSLFFQVRSIRREPGQAARRLMVATVKLRDGAGWFCGELTSADGETFALKLDGKSTVILKRSQIEWFYFDSKPMSAIELAGNLLDAKSWLSRSPSARLELSGRTVVVSNAETFSRPVTLPSRFEVRFEVPPDAGNGLRLWLQPSLQPPGSYTRGSMELQLGKTEAVLGIFDENLEKQTVLFQDGSNPESPAVYRFLYDGIGQRVAIVRNDKPLGSWPLFKKLDVSDRLTPIQALGFDRSLDGKKEVMKFNSIRVQPWDGMVTGGRLEASSNDLLSVGRQSAMPGKLTEISEKSLLFAGKRAAVAPEVFHEFASEKPSADFKKTENKLSFGFGGELYTASVEIREGKAICSTAFSPAFELPIDALEVITFDTSKPEQNEPASLLVFKNGDQFRGSLLPSSTPDGPLRWKTTSGQEIEFQLQYIAGVRFIRRTGAHPAANGASIDLRDGSRLRGELLQLDKNGLILKHPQLGRISLQRDQLWHIYPDPNLNLGDGTNEESLWVPGKRRVDNIAMHGFMPSENRNRWMIFNGFYLLSPEENGAAGAVDEDNIPSQLEELQAPLSFNQSDRFEVRAELSNAGGYDLFSFLILGAEEGAPFLTAIFNAEQLQIASVDPKHPEASRQQNVELPEKTPGQRVSMAVRIFVDSKLGIADFYLNGAPAIRFGKQPNDRIPGIGKTVSFSTFPVALTVFSNLWIGPWNGELPQPGGIAPPRTILSNGDTGSETPAEFHDNHFFLESEIGPIEIAQDKVQALDFGGTMTPNPAAPAARVVLVNGSSLNLSAFTWNGSSMSATSEILGELSLPADAIRELIYSPPKAQPPAVLPEKKPSKKILR